MVIELLFVMFKEKGIIKEIKLNKFFGKLVKVKMF